MGVIWWDSQLASFHGLGVSLADAERRYYYAEKPAVVDGTDCMEIAHCWCDSNRQDWFSPLAHVGWSGDGGLT